MKGSAEIRQSKDTNNEGQARWCWACYLVGVGMVHAAQRPKPTQLNHPNTYTPPPPTHRATPPVVERPRQFLPLCLKSLLCDSAGLGGPALGRRGRSSSSSCRAWLGQRSPFRGRNPGSVFVALPVLEVVGVAVVLAFSLPLAPSLLVGLAPAVGPPVLEVVLVLPPAAASQRAAPCTPTASIAIGSANACAAAGRTIHASSAPAACVAGRGLR
eukprot:1158128-Pelagomonas_calceolata.AAC.2